MRRQSIAAVLLLIASAVCIAEEGRPVRETFEAAGVRRSFYLFVPESLPDAPVPLLIALHGSGSDGMSLVRRWTDLARAEAFIVAGPNARDRDAWHLQADGPEVMRAVAEAVARRHPIERRRIYLFGNSGGAVYALTLSLLESEYFAAAAIHAGAWRSDKEFPVLQLARRRIPIAIFVGDRDRFFPLPAVRRTYSALQDAGHPVSLTILPGHAHDYRSVSAEVNRGAWEFLRTIRLELEPRFRSYDPER